MNSSIFMCVMLNLNWVQFWKLQEQKPDILMFDPNYLTLLLMGGVKMHTCPLLCSYSILQKDLKLILLPC